MTNIDFWPIYRYIFVLKKGASATIYNHFLKLLYMNMQHIIQNRTIERPSMLGRNLQIFKTVLFSTIEHYAVNANKLFFFGGGFAILFT